MRFFFFAAICAATAIGAPPTVPESKWTCANCHKAQTEFHASTPMARTLSTGADAEILKKHPKLTLTRGAYVYSIVREGDKSVYSVSDGQSKVSANVDWAVGLGAAGQTYVYELNGNFFESRVSFYDELNGLDVTMGANLEIPKNLEDALGRRMDKRSKFDCFNCHSTGGTKNLQVQFETLVPGIQCDKCHEGAQDHMAAIRAGNTKAAMNIPRLNKLSTEETSDLCGRCHRTWSQIATDGPRGVLNVRFPPYRLTNSKCYDSADQRISCVACHDPHRPSSQAAKVYDAKCLACHSAGSGSKAATRICHTATTECVTCHMPKVEIPGSHHKFMDHQIRIARQNEPYPN